MPEVVLLLASTTHTSQRGKLIHSSHQHDTGMPFPDSWKSPVLWFYLTHKHGLQGYYPDDPEHSVPRTD